VNDEQPVVEAEVVGLFLDGESVEEITTGGGATVILNASPFYGESGGQVGDSGDLLCADMRFRVKDTQKQGQALLHHGEVEEGSLKLGDQVRAAIDTEQRQEVATNHSATHLLHGALRNVLGKHVQQKGSLVTNTHLRFDFSHDQPVSTSELRSIERWVNDQIRMNGVTVIREMSLDDAMQAGAMALFGEKYGEQVRVVAIGDESKELCGGTHVGASGDIGAFRITLETGVAAGVRRIEALSGAAALTAIEAEHATLQTLSKRLKSHPDQVLNKITALQDNNRELTREIDQLKAKLSLNVSGELVDLARDVGGVKVLTQKIDQVDVKALRALMDQLKQKLSDAAIVLASEHAGKSILIAGVTSPLNKRVKAGDLVNVVAQELGGKGGGRPDMAQAGANSLDGIAEAFTKVDPWVASQMGT